MISHCAFKFALIYETLGKIPFFFPEDLYKDYTVGHTIYKFIGQTIVNPDEGLIPFLWILPRVHSCLVFLACVGFMSYLTQVFSSYLCGPRSQACLQQTFALFDFTIVWFF